MKTQSEKQENWFKTFLTPYEIIRIGEERFATLTGPPTPGAFPELEKSDEYDGLIRGWTQYWNDVLRPTPLLDPDVVKALIVSESHFKTKIAEPYAGPGNQARGILQLTDRTLQILNDAEGECASHLVHLDIADARDPKTAICAGIYWLIHKKFLNESTFKRNLTWREAIAYYKGYTSLKGKGMDAFDRAYARIQQRKGTPQT